MTAGRSAIVLGAGIQGVCAALALRSRGYRVTLIDQEAAPMLRASGRNEAKIHLGFVYANDASFRTASLMLDASGAFAPLLDGWLSAPLDWGSLRSAPFTYAVMRDSLLTVDQLEAFYERVQSGYVERGSVGYLGLRPERLWKPVKDNTWPSYISRDEVVGLMETEEVALDLPRFRRELVSRLEAMDDIETCFGRRVQSAVRTSSGFRVEGQTPEGGGWMEEADILVNCLWEGRLGLDAILGLEAKRSWVYRLKYRLLGELPRTVAALPSLTFVLGPYGDISTYRDSETYFSWYPACMRGWSSDLAPPPDWDKACRGVVDPQLAAEISREALTALDRIVPGLGEAKISTVDAGVIFSWGESHVDVDDPGSELHERHAIGVHEQDGYYSIDTGKFTCAPLFASNLIGRLG